MAVDQPLLTPVLLLTFNRPQTTVRVLDAVRAARPTRVFVASDGPRRDVPADTQRVLDTRRLVESSVDWPCTVERRYSDYNQGCRQGVSAAIAWFFSRVEQGIILEDDCVPHADFFQYCEELLSRYRDNHRVMGISGNNPVGLRLSEPTVSYCFTRQPLIWGWATWRRAWAHYDDNLDAWQDIRRDPTAQMRLWADPVERSWRAERYDRLADFGVPDAWDPRWSLSVAARGGLFVTPRRNLVTNIGFGEDATHTFKQRSRKAGVPSSGILPLEHPQSVTPDVAVERQIFDRMHGGWWRRRRILVLARRLLAGLRSRIRP